MRQGIACGSDDASVIRASFGLSSIRNEVHMQDIRDFRQEARVRSRARRMGYIVRHSRQRANVPNIDNLGEFMLIEANHNLIVLGERFDTTLDDIENYLGS